MNKDFQKRNILFVFSSYFRNHKNLFAPDSVTEAKSQRAFDALSQGRTIFIIAHRLSTIRSAQRIVSIADGVITECGSSTKKGLLF